MITPFLYSFLSGIHELYPVFIILLSSGRAPPNSMKARRCPESRPIWKNVLPMQIKNAGQKMWWSLINWVLYSGVREESFQFSLPAPCETWAGPPG